MIRVLKAGGRTATAFYCDHCQKQIADIQMALYTWKELDTFKWGDDDNDEPDFVISPDHPSVLVEGGNVYTVHKNASTNLRQRMVAGSIAGLH